MLTRNDILDIIFEELQGAQAPAAARSLPENPAVLPAAAPKKPARRVFFEDWQLRRMRVPGQKKIVLQKGAIVSPLARDWIDFDGIEIVYE